MPSTSERPLGAQLISAPHPALIWAGRVLAYVALICALTWPLVLHLDSALPGFPNVDSGDTVWLRGLVGPLLLDPASWPQSEQVFFPTGYPVLLLTPNVLDHALGGLIGAFASFPLSDNLLWLGSMLATGLAAHHLGAVLNPQVPWARREGAGFLLGVGWLSCDALLRELNLHHAPQTLCLWIPLYLAAFHQLLSPQASRKQMLIAGLAMVGAAMSYWYLALFAALGSLPMLLMAARGMDRAAWLRFGGAVGLSLVLTLPALAPFALSWDSLPVTSPDSAPMPLSGGPDMSALAPHLQFEASHGATPWFFAEAGPLDRSNRVSWVILVGSALAAVLAWRKGSLRTLLPWLAMAALSYVMVLGPWLKWGEELVLVGGSPLSMPFHWLGTLHPFLDRLTWPERWGLLLPLCLLAAACTQLPRPGLWALATLCEVMLLSPNAPIQTQSLEEELAWRVVSASSGAVLELPLKRDGLHAPLVGRHQRLHGHAVLNPLLLPPGSPKPQAWNAWMLEQELLSWLAALEGGEKPPTPTPETVADFAAQGVGAIALDAMPGSTLPKNKINRYVRELSAGLGEPQDYGSVVVWWLLPPARHAAPTVDGPAWRETVDSELGLRPRPELNTLIDPIWNAQLGRDLE